MKRDPPKQNLGMPPRCETPTKEIYGCSISFGDLRRAHRAFFSMTAGTSTIYHPRRNAGYLESCSCRCSAAHSATRLFPLELDVVIRVRIIPAEVLPPIMP